jgi:hypothetical protein
MNTIRVVYHLARADFYERVRRYSFLLMLGLIVFLGYQVANGNLTLTLGQYRGEYNSAWVGALMSINATFFLGWFGFYLVKDSVARDRETGVGQIIATTPLTRPLYMAGKWLSNLSVLMAMVTVLALSGIVIQFWKGESIQIDLFAFLSPFFFIVLPCMALIAAIAVLFEAIPFLQGGLGNIIYFVAFIISLPFFIENLDSSFSVFEPIGIGLLEEDMGKAVLASYPDYKGGFSLGPSEEIANTFTWTGIHWTPDLILARLALIGLAFGLTLLAAVFFDRFDSSRRRPVRSKAPTTTSPTHEPTIVLSGQPAFKLTPLIKASHRFSFFNVLLAELRLQIKGQPWWWYVIAGGLITASFANSSTITQEIVLPLAWIWPVLIWSSMGNREIHHNVQQLTYSSSSPLWRQLPAQWLAGFIVAILMGFGALMRFVIDGNPTAVLAFFSGAIFIPSLALALGVWSGTSKLFEIVYITIIYFGPLNRIPELDFIGSGSNGHPEFFIPLSITLISFAIYGRAQQVRR